MIPKIIHYCWLSGDPLPESVIKCIESWKINLPDYTIKKWDATSIDLNQNQYLKEAYECGKWAFASDYIRLYALYYEGGIYLDSDVYVRKSFDSFLSNDFFSSIEHCLSIKQRTCNIEAAVMGAIPKHIFIKKCLERFDNRKFILPDGTLDQCILPEIIADVAEKDFKFIRTPEEQHLEFNMHLYSPDVIAHAYLEASSDKKCVAIHLCDGGWYKADIKLHRRLYSLVRRILRNPINTFYMLLWKYKFNNELEKIKV